MNAHDWRAALLRELRPLIAVTALLVVVTTVAYPLAVTGVAQALFHRQANGSIVSAGGRAVGSSLIGQAFTSDAYFHGRPSEAGAGYDAANSGASNLGPTSKVLIDRVAADAQAFRVANGLVANAPLPADAVTASASGLDPHVSPATALLQVARVARARGVSAADVRALVDAHTGQPTLGIVGEPRVNVLELNLALDARFPAKP